MTNKKNIVLTILFSLTLLTTSLTNVANAASLDKKLEQCQEAFIYANSNQANPNTAVEADLKHLKLMKEVLNELNKQNADKKMTKAELQKNVMVMSHLLEMLVAENLNNKEQTWNVNY